MLKESRFDEKPQNHALWPTSNWRNKAYERNLIWLLGGDKPTRQPESLKVTEEKIISTAADIADYLICTFTTVADKAKRSLLTTNLCNLEKTQTVC